MRSVSSIPAWVGQFRKALAWPIEALEARQVSAALAAMSERERSDIGGISLEGAAMETPLREETREERVARARAIRAWYGHYPKAA